jgi:hypothetical protein
MLESRNLHLGDRHLESALWLRFGQKILRQTVILFFKRLPGLGSAPGIFWFHLFSHSITLPLRHSGSPTNGYFIVPNWKPFTYTIDINLSVYHEQSWTWRN